VEKEAGERRAPILEDALECVTRDRRGHVLVGRERQPSPFIAARIVTSMSSMTGAPLTPTASDFEPFSNSQRHTTAESMKMSTQWSCERSQGEFGLASDSKYRGEPTIAAR
jgi:hypothetical protein